MANKWTILPPAWWPSGWWPFSGVEPIVVHLTLYGDSFKNFSLSGQRTAALVQYLTARDALLATQGISTLSLSMESLTGASFTSTGTAEIFLEAS